MREMPSPFGPGTLVIGLVAALSSACADDDVSLTVTDFRIEPGTLAPGEATSGSWRLHKQAHDEVILTVTLIHGVFSDPYADIGENTVLFGVSSAPRGTGSFTCTYGLDRQFRCGVDAENLRGWSAGVSLPQGSELFTLRVCLLAFDGMDEEKIQTVCDTETFELTLQ